MSLRLRIALVLAAIAATATVAVGVVSYRVTADRLLEAVDDSLTQAGAVAISRRLDERLFERGPLAELAVRVVLADGRVLQTTFADAFPVTRREADLVGRPGQMRNRTARISGEEFRVHTIGFEDGLVQIGRPLEETNDVLATLRTRTALLVVAVSVLAAAVGALLAGRVTRPLRRLTDTAERVETTGRPDAGGLRVEPVVDGATSDEVARLTNAFARMLDALERSRADQTRLVQDAGHELRTPLTSLRTNLDMLARYPDLDAGERAEMLTAVRAEAEELTALVNEVVQLASGESDDVEPEAVVVSTVVDEAVRRVERRTGRTIAVTADDSTVWVRRAALARAVANLLDNAVKFSPADSPIDVTVEAGTVAVADRGPGVAAQDRERIFERFHRAEEARTLPGSGLGLSIVAEMARTHGGSVFVEDRPEGGAVIGMRLPVLDGADPWPAPGV
ncbi:MAG: ATP-binding protein [Ilumatobacteraceae bacterium]